ncbi:nuclear transport factor 2 family protein [Frankia sp. CNm7]|uniref:Nuclear transport factor 2 family protein n=1 Tax=Frankia nepalensis TaxID=1836974 RepID=A0A937UMQ8_9ACTN|nr:nuclear transport factor 2 family protein [Frankia nepalensis]MBL7511449.1 nuclear transport factor 2 family protein [Frankia nepalensis]MBL7523590.1 nuclear transport factor 2 family protein [Frankia nepalensis]MBL7627313.1 nuclear transport factor 2 family protein [Frankia nepalensis]
MTTDGKPRPAGLLAAGRSSGDAADRLALRDLAASYAAAADAGDGELFASLFTDEGVLRVSYADQAEPNRPVVGPAALAGIPRALRARFTETFHFVGNHRCQVDGDTAVGETYCEAHHLHLDEGGTPVDLRMAIRYADAYARGTDGVWRFARRAVNVLWQRVEPVTGSQSHR